MASLLEKIGTLISANLHYMVDEALKSNSIAVFDQYIRQVDNNLDELEDAAATVGGEARMLRRKYDEFAAKTAELDFPRGEAFAFVAGEAEMSRTMKAHLIARGLNHEYIRAPGYWVRGEAQG